MAGGVFHVEFGFNDTPLTRALESGNYKLAEKFINETTNPSALDEGKYFLAHLCIKCKVSYCDHILSSVVRRASSTFELVNTLQATFCIQSS